MVRRRFLLIILFVSMSSVSVNAVGTITDIQGFTNPDRNDIIFTISTNGLVDKVSINLNIDGNNIDIGSDNTSPYSITWNNENFISDILIEAIPYYENEKGSSYFEGPFNYLGIMEEVEICYEDDGGLDVFNFSHTYGFDLENNPYDLLDSCYENSVVEFQCIDNEYNYSLVDCGSLGEYLCEHGACVFGLEFGRINDLYGWDEPQIGEFILVANTTDPVSSVHFYWSSDGMNWNYDGTDAYKPYSTYVFTGWDVPNFYVGAFVEYQGEEGELYIEGPFEYFAQEAEVLFCFDSDGLDYYNAGYVNFSNDIFNDVCLDQNSVLERSCENNILFNQSHICLDICESGACTNSETNSENETVEVLENTRDFSLDLDISKVTPHVFEEIEYSFKIKNKGDKVEIFEYELDIEFNGNLFFEDKDEIELKPGSSKTILDNVEFDEPGEYLFRLRVQSEDSILNSKITEKIYVKYEFLENISIFCESNDDCPNPYFANFYCKDNSVYRDMVSYICLDPGKSYSKCVLETETGVLSICNLNEFCIDGYPTCLANKSNSFGNNSIIITTSDNSAGNVLILVFVLLFLFIIFISLLIAYAVKSKSNENLVKMSKKNIMQKDYTKNQIAARQKSVIKTLSERQKNIVKILQKNKGTLAQNKLVIETGLVKSSLSRNLRALELKNIIERQNLGNVKRIKFTDFFLS